MFTLLALASPAHAHIRHRHRPHAAAPTPFFIFGNFTSAVVEPPVKFPRATRHVRSYPAPPSVILGGRPPGCPRAFCGCGASLRVFGRIVPRLNLARAWLDFPRAAPAPGMAAARTHHVMVLVAPGSRPGLWLVHDSNSGHHLTRLHEVSLRGYTVVDPRSGPPARWSSR
jgi:hypothetical protein